MREDVGLLLKNYPKQQEISNKQELEKERQDLMQEATELMNIFGSILRKSE